MIYKRATKALKDAGIDHIQIVKYLWGPAPEDTRATKQTSRCFDTWQKARDAVLDGYRPSVEEWKPEFEAEVFTPILEELKYLCKKLNESFPDDSREFVVGPYGFICLVHKD